MSKHAILNSFDYCSLDAVLPGWEYLDGIWNGPWPLPERFSTEVRMCANCGEHFELCNGCCKAGDLLPALRGEPLTCFPRELCFTCATLRCWWDETGKLRKTWSSNEAHKV